MKRMTDEPDESFRIVTARVADWRGKIADDEDRPARSKGFWLRGVLKYRFGKSETRIDFLRPPRFTFITLYDGDSTRSLKIDKTDNYRGILL